MYPNKKEDTKLYKVVVNYEEQYSICLANKDNLLGWKNTEKSGLKSECIEYIQEVWTDMIPLSLKNKMQEKLFWKAY